MLKLAAIAAVDGFGDIGGHEVKALTYLKLSGGTPAGAEQPFAKKIDTAVSIEKALQTLEKLIADYQDPQSVYVSEPLGQGVVRYSDYRHLARVKEWASFGAEDETEDDAESELS